MLHSQIFRINKFDFWCWTRFGSWLIVCRFRCSRAFGHRFPPNCSLPFTERDLLTQTASCLSSLRVLIVFSSVWTSGKRDLGGGEVHTEKDSHNTVGVAVFFSREGAAPSPESAMPARGRTAGPATFDCCIAPQANAARMHVASLAAGVPTRPSQHHVREDVVAPRRTSSPKTSPLQGKPMSRVHEEEAVGDTTSK